MQLKQLSPSLQVAIQIYRLGLCGVYPTKSILENRLPGVDVDKALDAGLDLEVFTSIWSTDLCDFVYSNAYKWGLLVKGIAAALEDESAGSSVDN